MKRTPEQLLELAKSLKTDELNKEAIRVMDSVMTEYSTWEAAAWPILREEAIQYKLDGTIGEYMTVEIGIKYSAEQLATVILGKAEALKNFRSNIIKNRQEHESRISGFTSIKEVDEYNLSIGWT